MRTVVSSILFLYLVHHITALAPTIDLNDGNKIPVLALGTGRGTAKEHETVDDVRHAVYWAIEAGYRHIDTAAVYGDEAEVGQGIADAIAKGLVKREDLFVTTKLWCDKHRQEQVVPSLRESLAKLGLSYVDLYLVHFPSALDNKGNPIDLDYLITWKGMEEARNLGLTKSIGVSNFNSSQLDRLISKSNIKPAVNQIEVNPTFTQEALVSHCQRLGVAVMAYSPFGYLVSRRKSETDRRLDDPVLVNIAKKYGKNPAQIVLRYLIERDLVAIPKSTNKERIEQNINIFDFHLNEQEMEAISKFNTNERVISFAGWEDYPYFPFKKN